MARGGESARKSAARCCDVDGSDSIIASAIIEPSRMKSFRPLASSERRLGMIKAAKRLGLFVSERPSHSRKESKCPLACAGAQRNRNQIINLKLSSSAGGGEAAARWASSAVIAVAGQWYW